MHSKHTADPDVVTLIDQIFADWQRRRSVATDGDLDMELWRRLEELGLAELTSTPEGGTWAESAVLLRTAAQYAAPIPYAEHDLVARWLSQRTGLPCTGIATAASMRSSPRPGNHLEVSGRVPWASVADTLVMVWEDTHGWRACSVSPENSQVRIEPHRDLSGRSYDHVSFDPSVIASTAIDPTTVEVMRLRTILARTAQMSGAMSESVRVATRYSAERNQFGKSIGSQQAVQRLVVDAAAECALATLSLDAAVATAVDAGDDIAALQLPVAVAASLMWHASSVVIRNVHQVLGALGTTREHTLHRLTRPVLAWRAEEGTAESGDARIARLLLSGKGSVWSKIVPLSEAPDSVSAVPTR